MIYEYERRQFTSMQDLMSYAKKEWKHKKRDWITIIKWKGSKYVKEQIQVK